MNWINKKKQCYAFSKNSNQRCSKTSLPFSNYCFLHYPKKILVLEFFITLILTLIFSEPLIHFLSKIPFLRYVDKNKPVIEEIIPPINKIQMVDKKNNTFDVICSDKESGLDLQKSYLMIKFKDNDEYKPIIGKLIKGSSKLRFVLDKELEFGEYLFELSLIDKANNRTEFVQSFVVREKDELAITVGGCEEFEKSEYRNMFSDFLESKKDFLRNCDLYVVILNFFNKDTKAILKDLYLTVSISGLGTFFCWKELRNLKTKDVKILNFAESMDKTIPEGNVFLSDNLLDISEIGPDGMLTFVILVGEDKVLSIRNDKTIWNGINIFGIYRSEGYGNHEVRRIEYRLPLTKSK